MAPGPICKAKQTVTQDVKGVSDLINSRIALLYQDVVDGAKKAKSTVGTAEHKTVAELQNRLDSVKRSYTQAPWRSRRPDLTLLVEIMLAVVFLVILYRALPLLTASNKPAFSKDQFQKALKLPEGAFNVTELAKVNLEVKALQDYRSFFDFRPYSYENSGMGDLVRANAVLPFVMFAIQYVIPPFVIAYIIWFIIRFWPYVIAAVWGWYLMLYEYFTRLIQCKLGCKWYISMMTGWGCCSPDFSEYFNAWRRKYIDIPVYTEKMKYVQKYLWAKRVYYEIPYRKYIELPIKRYKVKAEFAKKIYVDRAIEVFLKKLRELYDPYYQLPKDELYRHLLSNNRNLAALYAKTKQAKAQIEGKEYSSVTTSGKVCKCPASKTPVSLLRNAIKVETGHIKDDLESMIEATNKIYDKLNSLEIPEVDPTDCKTYDSAIAKRHSIAKWMLISIVAVCASLFVWSQVMGTPTWLRLILTPATTFASRGLGVIMTGTSSFSWVWVYLGLITTFLTIVWLT